MNTEIQTLNFRNTTLRTLTDKAEDPWFVAKDVYDTPSISNPSTVISPDKNEVTQINPKDYLEPENRSNQTVNITSKPDPYKLIKRSQKPEAKESQHRVTHEMPPQTHKTGTLISEKQPREWHSQHDWTYRHAGTWNTASKRVKASHQAMVESKTHRRHKDSSIFAFTPTVKITRKGLTLLHTRRGETHPNKTLEATIR